MSIISSRTHQNIHRQLQQVDPIFAKLWSMHSPMELCDDVEHAGLCIDGDDVSILFNQSYWRRLSSKERLFVICHEHCHWLFGHCRYANTSDVEWINIAQDIEVNEFLREYYGSKLTIPKDACTLDMVFKHKAHKVLKLQDSDYYLELILKCVSSDR